MQMRVSRKEQKDYVDFILELTGWDKHTLCKESKISEWVLSRIYTGRAELTPSHYWRIQCAVKMYLTAHRQYKEMFALIYKNGRWHHVTVEKFIKSTPKRLG